MEERAEMIMKSTKGCVDGGSELQAHFQTFREFSLTYHRTSHLCGCSCPLCPISSLLTSDGKIVLLFTSTEQAQFSGERRKTERLWYIYNRRDLISLVSLTSISLWISPQLCCKVVQLVLLGAVHHSSTTYIIDIIDIPLFSQRPKGSAYEEGQNLCIKAQGKYCVDLIAGIQTLRNFCPFLKRPTVRFNCLKWAFFLISGQTVHFPGIKSNSSTSTMLYQMFWITAANSFGQGKPQISSGLKMSF